jgi:hypothetical protein
VGDGDILRIAQGCPKTSGRVGTCKGSTRSANDVAVPMVEESGGVHVRRQSRDDEKR